MRIDIHVEDDTEEGVVVHHYVSRERFEQAVAQLNRRIDQMSSQEQQDVDALTAAIGQQGQTVAQVKTDLDSTQSTIQAEVNNLQAQIDANQPPNLDALKAAVQANGDALAPLDGVVQQIGAIVPQPPAPTAPTA